MEYAIEFRNITNNIIGVVENITGSFYCTSDNDNAISVIAWATYESKQGVKSKPPFLTAALATTTTITTTITTAPITTNKLTGKLAKGIKLFIYVFVYKCM